MARRCALRLAREGNRDSPTFSDPSDPPYPGKNRQQLTANSQQSTANNLQATANFEGRRTAGLAVLATAVASLPHHLGWGSTAQTAVLRAAAKRRNKSHQTDKKADLSWLEGLQGLRTEIEPAPLTPLTAKEAQFSADATISLAPSLGMAILRKKQAACSRLWLLLRAIDTNGRGAISLDQARQAFTDKESTLHFCGQRQLRNLIIAGTGLFWDFDGKQIWLRSAVRVARALGVSHFRGQEVAIPISALGGGIGAVRANLFASFHSGRNSKPIARQTLAKKSGVAPRTQRRYDRLSGVSKQANYARGPKLDSKEAQEQAWQQGPASFAWREARKGRDGQDARFLAWQLPNSYHGPHARLGRGRQKRQNKALADLLNKGTAGNDQRHYDGLVPRYFADARAASRAHGRNSTAVYWPAIDRGTWHWLPASYQTPAMTCRSDEGNVNQGK